MNKESFSSSSPYPFSKIRLSHSALEILQACEQKFEIERFFKGSKVEEANPDFIWGKSYGIGFQEYLLTRDMDQAIWKVFLSYTPWVEKDSKQFWKIIHGLVVNQEKIDTFLETYELVQFHKVPAIELGIKIIIDDVFYYVGFIDAVVKNKQSGKYAILECKSTGSSLYEIDPMYRHSGQGIGYSIGLDTIVGETLTDYDIIYPVLQYPSRLASTPIIHFLRFEKNLLDRLQWFITLQLDVDKIKTMFQLNHFPKRSTACLAYNRVCPHYGTCHLLSIREYKDEEPDPHEKKYSFTFLLQDIIEEHLRRVKPVTLLQGEIK
jgi:hypothetical protein